MTDQVIKYDIAEATIQKWNKDFMQLTVKDVNDNDGYKNCYEARQIIKTARVDVEKTRKILKADALEYGRKVDAEAKRITEKLTPIEDYLMGQQKIVDDEKARIKAEEEAKQKKIIADRRQFLLDRGANFDMTNFALGSFSVDDLTLSIMTDDEWLLIKPAVENAHSQVEALKRIEAEKQAEVERQIAEQNALIEKQKQEIAQAQAELQAERDRIEAERKAIADKEAEKQREIETLERIEREKKLAVEKAEAERIEREKYLAEEKAKEEAIKPDMIKLEVLASEIDEMTQTVVMFTEKGIEILAEVRSQLFSVSQFIRKNI